MTRRSSPSSRPGAATSRSRRTSSRRSLASTATSSCRRPSRPRGCRPFRGSPLELRDGVRDVLVGAGLAEVVTHALVSPRHLERVAWATPPGVADGEAAAAGTPITVTNPLSADHAVLRQSLVASLLDVVSTNVRRGRSDVAIFEVGKGYGRVGEETREWWRLGIALHGPFEVPAWNRPARDADLDDAKGLVELLARFLGLEAPVYAALSNEPNLHPGRAANVIARDSSRRNRPGRTPG